MRPVDFFILALLIVAGGIYLAIRAGAFNKRKGTGRGRGSGRIGPNLSRAEKKVMEALEAQGYKLSRIHPYVSLSYNHNTSNGQKRKDYTHAANFIVSKRGSKYLVKLVKSGVKSGSAPSPTSPDFRNELLIDYLFFLPRGIIIYNTDKDTMEEVFFKPGIFYAMEKKFAGITFAVLMFAAVVWAALYLATEVFSF